ncbi:MAG TPA: DUF4375 domain-containing protein [Longimicrobium sp.]|nr:DUF4375 domain-containing protein [Longimicrobium sp.]
MNQPLSPDLRVDPQSLREADPAELAWAVIAPAYDAVSFYDGPEALAESMRALTPGQRALLALHWCVAEVSNGGFDGFFTNPSGLLATEAVEGFRRIGATEAADLVARALEVFAERPPTGEPENPEFDEYEDAVAFDAYDERYDPLQERFFALLDAEIYPKAAAYVRGHPDQFVR